MHKKVQFQRTGGLKFRKEIPIKGIKAPAVASEKKDTVGVHVDSFSEEWQVDKGSFQLTVPVNMNPHDKVKGTVVFKVGQVTIPYTAILVKKPKNGGPTEESVFFFFVCPLLFFLLFTSYWLTFCVR